NEAMYNSGEFFHGITNGAEWYPVTGGMMDWNYHYLGCMGLTIELSPNEMPDPDSLMVFWDYNRESMLSLLEEVHTGLRGIVTDSLDGTPIPAAIKVSEISKTVYNDPDLGDYYRLLEPGTYQVLFEADGYYPKLFNGIKIDSVSVKKLNVQLKPVVYYTVEGIVSDSLSGEPLQNAGIYFYQNRSLIDSVKTGSSGEYSLDLPTGEYKVFIKYPDYFEEQYKLNLTTNTSLNFRLLKIIPGNIAGSVTVINGDYHNVVIYCQHKTDTLYDINSYQIDDIIPGKIVIFAWKFGYETTIMDTFLNNGSSLDLNIVLHTGNNDFFNAFEEPDKTFYGDGDWMLDLITSGPLRAHSGNYAWATNPAGNYTSGPKIHSLETKVFSIQGMAVPELELYHWFDIENHYDGANIKVSDESGSKWQVINPDPYYSVETLTGEYGNPMAGQPVFSGASGGWNKITFNLQNFRDWPFIKFRFDLGVDGQKNAAGWYLDDFRIIDANATGTAGKERFIAHKLKVNIYPNPANPTARFNITPVSNGQLVIRLYNINGELVNQYSSIVHNNQNITWQWPGINLSGHPVGSGIYFARIQNGKYFSSAKIILIR
ncbi:MAG: carboxypeptidase regulatory-like domain-containing protein, partial [Calditrichaceae bacterium]